MIDRLGTRFQNKNKNFFTKNYKKIFLNYPQSGFSYFLNFYFLIFPNGRNSFLDDYIRRDFFITNWKSLSYKVLSKFVHMVNTRTKLVNKFEHMLITF